MGGGGGGQGVGPAAAREGRGGWTALALLGAGTAREESEATHSRLAGPRPCLSSSVAHPAWLVSEPGLVYVLLRCLLVQAFGNRPVATAMPRQPAR